MVTSYDVNNLRVGGTEYDRRTKLTAEQKKDIVSMYATGQYTQRQLATMFNVSSFAIVTSLDPSKNRRYYKTFKERHPERVAYVPGSDSSLQFYKYKQRLLEEGVFKVPESVPKKKKPITIYSDGIMPTKNFRSIKGKFPEGVFEDPRNPLVKLDNQSELSVYAKDMADKIELLVYYKENPDTCRLIFTWQGKISSDVFELTSEDVEILLFTNSK